MRNLILTIAILLLTAVTVQAQVKGEAEYLVRYEVKFAVDTMNLEKISKETHRLYTGTKTSHYISDARFYMDSITSLLDNNPSGIGINFDEISDPNSQFDAIVYKDLVNTELWVRNTINMTEFHYKETGVPIQWEYTDETKEVEQYTAHKATTSYGGRSYEAWFALDVPILDGPYVFSGLPGLIIELYDTEKEFHFKLASFSPLDQKYPIDSKSKTGKRTTKEAFTKAFKVYKANPEISLARDLPDNIVIRGVNGEVITKRDLIRQTKEIESRRNNQIEKW